MIRWKPSRQVNTVTETAHVTKWRAGASGARNEGSAGSGGMQWPEKAHKGPPPPNECMQPEVDRRWWERKGSRWLLNASSPLIFHGKESSYYHLGLPLLFSQGSSNFSEALRSLSCCLPVLPEALALKTLPTILSCYNKGIWWEVSLQCRPKGLGLQILWRASFPTGLILPPASRMFFDYQKGNKKIIASWANRRGFPQDHLSFGFIESSEQYWAPLLKPKVILFETIFYGCLRSAKKSLCNFNLFNLCF